MRKGFTLLETIVVLVFISIISIIFIIQKNNYDAMERDEARKIAINAIYYSLEEGFYKQNSYYPESISESNLPTVTPELWTDPSGHLINTPEAEYLYEPANCYQGRCQEYTLKALLEKEQPYIKTNRN